MRRQHSHAGETWVVQLGISLFMYFLFIYLFVLATPCSMQDLTRDLDPACKISDQGWNLCPLQWKPGVLTNSPPGKSLEWSHWYAAPDYQISAIYERGNFPWPGGLISTQPLSICWAWTWAWQMERRHFVHLSLVKLARHGINCPPSPLHRHKSREECFCSRRVWIFYYILLINVIPYSLNTDMNNEKNCILLLPYI